jgi:hypothetical protein
MCSSLAPERLDGSHSRSIFKSSLIIDPQLMDMCMCLKSRGLLYGPPKPESFSKTVLAIQIIYEYFMDNFSVNKTALELSVRK